MAPYSAIEIGQRLRSLRLDRAESLNHVGEQCDMSAATLSRIENGKQELSLRSLLRLCAALNCHPDDVLKVGRDAPPTSAVRLRDVQRLKAAFDVAAEHINTMVERLTAPPRRTRKRRP